MLGQMGSKKSGGKSKDRKLELRRTERKKAKVRVAHDIVHPGLEFCWGTTYPLDWYCDEVRLVGVEGGGRKILVDYGTNWLPRDPAVPHCKSTDKRLNTLWWMEAKSYEGGKEGRHEKRIMLDRWAVVTDMDYGSHHKLSASPNKIYVLLIIQECLFMLYWHMTSFR